MRTPGATYRLQFHPGFGFADALALVPYLDSLGVTDLYASPLLAARRGSAHGYDVVDPTRLNPELGSPEEFDALAAELRRRGMGLVLDVVPNHMAMSHENPWWMDVLEHGPASRFAGFFDIDWQAPGLEGKVLVPVLGGPYADALDRGQLRLELEDGTLFVRYPEHRFPVDPKTYGLVFGDGFESFQSRLGPSHQAVLAVRTLLRLIERIPPRRMTGRRSVERRVRGTESVKAWIREILEASPEARKHLEARVVAWGGDPSPEANRERLDTLIGEQAYVLSFWRAAAHEVDYRRFFDVTELVALRAQDPAVFEATHVLVLELMRRGDVTGLRIDHVDGLYDPQGYVERLRDRTGGAFVVVEKILARDERLRDDWPVAGATGYDFLDDVNGVLTDGRGAAALGAQYARLTGRELPFDQVAVEAKRTVIQQLFEGEVAALTARLQRLARQDRRGRDLTAAGLALALTEVTASLGVYRTYVRTLEVSGSDRDRIDRAVAGARARMAEVSGVPPETAGALEFLHRVLLLDLRPRPAPGARISPRARAWLEFVMRWQQFTGPVMAKGVEDTAMYRYNRLVSRNDVGTDPGTDAVPVPELHRRLRIRARRWPDTLNATSTHDTKRGQDVRARIGVLSEMPDQWVEAVERWMRTNAPKRQAAGGIQAPDPNEEWLIYQTLAGAWPLDRAGERGFAGRMAAYLQKALREAKVHSSWVDPDPAHEAAVERFVRRVIADRTWRREFQSLHRRVAFHGALGGLSQALMKVAAPGVPDLYQGTELWDLSLVDPDNRRPVDFELRRGLLVDLDRRAADDLDGLIDELVGSWQDGRIKLFVLSRALRYRRDHPEPFARGTHVAVAVRGVRRNHVCAFVRRRRSSWVLAAAARLTVGLGEGVPVGATGWDRTVLTLPPSAPRRWVDAISGQRLELEGGRLRAGELFSRLPVALLGPEPSGV